MAFKKPKKWMQKAVKRPGAFGAKAKRAKMSTAAFARKMRKAPGRLGKQARLALVFERAAKNRTGKRPAKRSTKRRTKRATTRR